MDFSLSPYEIWNVVEHLGLEKEANSIQKVDKNIKYSKNALFFKARHHGRDINLRFSFSLRFLLFPFSPSFYIVTLMYHWPAILHSRSFLYSKGNSKHKADDSAMTQGNELVSSSRNERTSATFLLWYSRISFAKVNEDEGTSNETNISVYVEIYQLASPSWLWTATIHDILIGVPKRFETAVPWCVDKVDGICK
jgi:hypothetical protein